MITAKLFKNGNSQAVRLPKQFRFKGNEVFVQKEGEVLFLIPKNSGWHYLKMALSAFTPDLQIKRNQPRRQKRQRLFK